MIKTIRPPSTWPRGRKPFLTGLGHQHCGSGRHPALWEQRSQAIRHPVKQEFHPATRYQHRAASALSTFGQQATKKEFARAGAGGATKHRVLCKAQSQNPIHPIWLLKENRAIWEPFSSPSLLSTLWQHLSNKIYCLAAANVRTRICHLAEGAHSA